METERNIDLEMLIIFLGLSLLNFAFYVVKHPIIHFFNKDMINSRALLKIYSVDLILFISILIPYVVLLVVIIFFILIKKVKVSDSFFMFLFFPLVSFFSKGMFLPQVYIEVNMVLLLRDNLAFFLFLLFGPFVLLFQNLFHTLHKRS